MFTGIIEEVGTLLATRKASKSESLTIEAPYVLQDAKSVSSSVALLHLPVYPTFSRLKQLPVFFHLCNNFSHFSLIYSIL